MGGIDGIMSKAFSMLSFVSTETSGEFKRPSNYSYCDSKGLRLLVHLRNLEKSNMI
jgi:hypothetical protein